MVVGNESPSPGPRPVDFSAVDAIAGRGGESGVVETEGWVLRKGNGEWSREERVEEKKGFKHDVVVTR